MDGRFPATELPNTVILLDKGTHCAIQADKTHRNGKAHTILHSGVNTFHNCHHATKNNSYLFKKTWHIGDHESIIKYKHIS